jgi:hypothetical protein
LDSSFLLFTLHLFGSFNSGSGGITQALKLNGG